jgi:hypothetical protein
MKAYSDVQPRALERAGDPRWRPAPTRSVQESIQESIRESIQDRTDIGEVDKRATGPDADPPYDYRALAVAASAWLAFYVIAIIHELIAPGY